MGCDPSVFTREGNDNMSEAVYYSLHLGLSGLAPSMMLYQEDKNDLYLTVHGKLGGRGKEVHLDSLKLAEEFMSAYMPRLKKRYGDDVEVSVIKCTFRGSNKRTLAKIEEESALARKRIETGILASNRRPE